MRKLRFSGCDAIVRHLSRLSPLENGRAKNLEKSSGVGYVSGRVRADSKLLLACTAVEKLHDVLESLTKFPVLCSIARTIARRQLHKIAMHKNVLRLFRQCLFSSLATTFISLFLHDCQINWLKKRSADMSGRVELLIAHVPGVVVGPGEGNANVRVSRLNFAMSLSTRREDRRPD
ncbi:hypothetical protein PUN28_010761 [Cardiocondyla obscurior]|uniref:Uncharacterized protein n=1 Tax=Cardiocondyla obscurior TaxID=286306 RepID=A0AAW2FJM3_9HYME